MDGPNGGFLTAEDVCQALCAAPVPAGSIAGSDPGTVPGKPGLYAWWAVPGALPGIPRPAHPSLPLGLLYVGIAKVSLRQRVVGQHLGANTGSSTFRFTLAAHLVTDGQLTPYRMAKKVLLPPAQLAWLLRWQVSHLSVSWITRDEPAAVETAVIGAMRPPLNGDDNGDHPYRQPLRDIRAAFRLRATDGRTVGE
ncbi:GIY-YIG nuclease family protein [Protofrankia coriariae]|uniref:GIY-YIG catalytic domain-containing protein n=1 Tax=Protofrankia coriariae TaxID=1562887 RepID=A0ABR5EZ01_9ACTN|nr:hypothetical protein FrCorBMG51_23195 [Protofrankia coriariae]